MEARKFQTRRHRLSKYPANTARHSRLPKLQENHIASARTTDEASEMLQDFDSAGIWNDAGCGQRRGERDLFGVLRRLHSRLI